jgi:Fe-S-cluster containining protein
VNGFVMVEKRRREKTFVFHCTHFDRNSRLCDSYGSRPGMCRDYPRVLIYQQAPEFFSDCGFKALSPKRQELLQALDAKSLDDHQMKKLKKELYLE